MMGGGEMLAQSAGGLLGMMMAPSFRDTLHKYAKRARGNINQYADNLTNAYNQNFGQVQGYLQSMLPSQEQMSGVTQEIAALLGLDPGGMETALQHLQQSPGYQFRLQQANDELQRKFNAGGLAFSGNFANAATAQSQNMAEDHYGNRLGYLQSMLTQSQAPIQGLTNLAKGAYDIQNQKNTALYDLNNYTYQQKYGLGF